MPAVATLLLVLAAGFAVVAWRQRSEDPARVTYTDVAGALTLIGLCAAATIDPTKWCASSRAIQHNHDGDRSNVRRALTTETEAHQKPSNPSTLNTSPGPSGSANAAMSDWNIRRSGPHEPANESGCDHHPNRSRSTSLADTIRAARQTGRSGRRGARLRRRARPEPCRGAAAPGAVRTESAEERAGNAVVETAARAVREFPGDHPAGRHCHLDDRVAAAGPARERPALRSNRHHGDRRAQRHARLHPGGRARRNRCAR